MKYYIIAGEASGDLHGSNLMEALLNEDVDAQFRFWGGDLMNAVDGTMVKHYKDLAFMGFLEVLMNLGTILKNLRFCKRDIIQYDPDVIIFIDYPGFNLRIAKWAKAQGYRTHYYISPQIWAWKENRIHDIKRDIDKMFVILPFEEEFYREKYNYPAIFVGHPLLDAIAQRKQRLMYEFKAKHGLSDKPIIALLPGSRKQEIKKMLRIMLQMADRFHDYQFVIAGAPGLDRDFYTEFTNKSNMSFVNNKTYDLLSLSYAALVTSGTATLETALFKIPQVVCYKGSWLSYQIGKRIVKVDYISLVNLIMKKEVVKELIQNDFSVEKLEKELQNILMKNVRERIFLDYYELEQKLGGRGASAKTAQLIYEDLTSSN